tara:strand:- start:32 stop:481 length:450 start_codon:yes stop_codon:yes gene_type:complete
MSNDTAVDIVVDINDGESVQSEVQELVWKHTRDLASPPDEIILNCWAVWDDDAFDPQWVSDLALPFFIDKHGRVMLDDNVNRATGFRGVDEDCFDLVDRWLGKPKEECDRLSFIIEFNFKDEREEDMFNPELRIMLDTEIHILNDNKEK